MEITITKGRGYVSAEKGKADDQPIGVIAVDSIFCPVTKVNLTIDPLEDGQEDKLTLDVTTNGAMSPEDAVSLSARIFESHLQLFANMEIIYQTLLKFVFKILHYSNIFSTILRM